METFKVRRNSLLLKLESFIGTLPRNSEIMHKVFFFVIIAYYVLVYSIELAYDHNQHITILSPLIESHLGVQMRAYWLASAPGTGVDVWS